MEGLSELGRAAVALAEMGFAVLPLKPRGKEPDTRHGCKDATTDLDQVARWWREKPARNVGVACGEASGGLLVLDFDVHPERGVVGTDALAGRSLPGTCSQVTGSGGYHLLYRAPGAGIGCYSNGTAGVDVRGEGGYIVVPPSVHPGGGRYEWEVPPDEMGPQPADDRVLALVEEFRPRRAPSGAPGARYEAPAVISEGGRNDELARLCGQLWAKGVDRDLVRGALREANRLRCAPPLPEEEVDRIWGSITSKPKGRSPEWEAAHRRDAPKPEAVTAPGAAGPAPADGDDGEGGGIRGPRGGLKTNRVAQMVMRRNRARIIDGAPAVWTGGRWDFGARAINRCVLDIADDAKRQDKAEVASYIMDRAPAASIDRDFDGGYYVQFANATYDVVADRVVEPRPEMYIVATLPVELDFEAGRNVADDFLDSVSGGDAAVRSALAEVIGACMCSRRVADQSPMLIGRAGGAKGKASNGKSTFINWLRAILGTENTSSLDIATLGQRFQAGRVVGKLANLGDDIPDGFLEGSELATFKKLVTGDSIYTDVKGSDGYEFRPSATMVFSMNSVPRLSDTTDGIFRRLYFIPFRRRFAPGVEGFDPKMAERLAAPDALRRGALIGLKALRDVIERGCLVPIPGMEEEVEEVRQDNDSVARWLCEEDVEAGRIAGRAISDVYKNYSQWCQVAGERNPCSLRTFSARVRESTRFKEVTVVTETRKIAGHSVKAFAVKPL